MRPSLESFSELTLEQVIRRLNTICHRWLRSRRHRANHFPADPEAFTRARIAYHQHRNLAAKHARGMHVQRESQCAVQLGFQPRMARLGFPVAEPREGEKCKMVFSRIYGNGPGWIRTSGFPLISMPELHKSLFFGAFWGTPYP